MSSRIPSALRLAIPVIVGMAMSGCGSGGGSNTGVTAGNTGSDWLIPANEVVDGGPGQDGIPAIDRPVMMSATSVTDIEPTELIVGVRHEGEIHAYSHNILNWHEVVNDSINLDDFVLSYCPLTGSAVSWDVDDNQGNTEFGVSGLLYNSNLILYDRETGSRWSQMLQQAVQGPRSTEHPHRVQVIETTWSTWLAMYPGSFVLTRSTGFSRSYDMYPYGNYRHNEELLFPVSNSDNRLHPKDRVIGIYDGTSSKIYQLDGFGTTTQAINDQFAGQPIVAVGNSEENIAAIYSRELADGSVLTFTALDGQLPNILSDTEGNTWDVFGNATSGPRVGERLAMTNSYTAMWFAWAAFFPNAEIHFN